VHDATAGVGLGWAEEDAGFRSDELFGDREGSVQQVDTSAGEPDPFAPAQP
jgi:hypothetical protein